MTRTNGQWRLKTRPVGMVKESDFELVEEPLAEIADGEVLVRNLFLAFEPAMRGWLDDVPSYIPPVQIGEVMRASSVGQIVESKNDDFAVGQIVSGLLGWQQYFVTDGTPGPFGGLSHVPDGIPPQRMLSVLGGTGLTAYFGINEIHPIQEGDNVLVSGAAGATGSVASQIARIKGAGKVAGLAGGDRQRARLHRRRALGARQRAGRGPFMWRAQLPAQAGHAEAAEAASPAPAVELSPSA